MLDQGWQDDELVPRLVEARETRMHITHGREALYLWEWKHVKAGPRREQNESLPMLVEALAGKEGGRCIGR